MKNVIIYARVSTWQQTKGSGLQRQIEVCNEYALKKNYEVIAVFSEIRSAAEPYDTRKQAEKMSRLTGATILCEAYDRWSRKGVSDVPKIKVEFVWDINNLISGGGIWHK